MNSALGQWLLLKHMDLDMDVNQTHCMHIFSLNLLEINGLLKILHCSVSINAFRNPVKQWQSSALGFEI